MEHHISYDPPLILVNVESEDATFKNILSTKSFGVSIASSRQNIPASISGRYSGKSVDKISLLKELGFEFYGGQKIKAPMLKNATVNAELELVKHETMGDHIILIGKVLTSSVNEGEVPLVYSEGRYWRLETNIQKPKKNILDKIVRLAEKYQK